MLYFVLGLLSLTSLYFFLRCRTMAGAVRRTNRALKEISGELEANRVRNCLRLTERWRSFL